MADDNGEHYTTDGGKLAPYPDMTDDDLREFEKWEDELMDKRNTSLWRWCFIIFFVFMVYWAVGG